MEKSQMIALAQAQLEAYNQRDIETFCKHYHPDVEVYRLPSREPICLGLQSFRDLYKKRFDENPQLHCELKSRTILNNSVIDEEWVTGVVGAQAASHVSAIYFFKENLIHQIYFAF